MGISELFWECNDVGHWPRPLRSCCFHVFAVGEDNKERAGDKMLGKIRQCLQRELENKDITTTDFGVFSRGQTLARDLMYSISPNGGGKWQALSYCIIPVLEMRKMKAREVKPLIQSDTVRGCPWSPGSCPHLVDALKVGPSRSPLVWHCCNHPPPPPTGFQGYPDEVLHWTTSTTETYCLRDQRVSRWVLLSAESCDIFSRPLPELLVVCWQSLVVLVCRFIILIFAFTSTRPSPVCLCPNFPFFFNI